ncbi:MAG: class I SAM-dependent methyltransferase [Cyanobacteria bacterium J06633_2]
MVKSIATPTSKLERTGAKKPDSKFWDNIAERYSKQPISDEASYQKKLQITQEYFNAEMEVLEFGCGTGSTAIIHAPYVKHIRAIDISSNMINIARCKAEVASIQNVTFEQATVEDINVPDQTLDAVLGLSILHLLADRDAAIAKVYGMLRPGGLFVTSTACLGDAMAWFKLIAPIGRLFDIFPLVKVFTEQDLVESLVASGFAIDYQWRPAKDKAVFIVAKKPE